MLILGRHLGQRILIGDDVVVEVVGITSDEVRLGVTAPRHVAVDRQEIRAVKLAHIEGAEPD